MTNISETELFSLIFSNIPNDRISKIDQVSYAGKLYEMISVLKKNECDPIFTTLFESFSANDFPYYDRQMKKLTLGIRELFSDCDLSVFVEGVRTTVARELLMVYYRMILYPHERSAVEEYMRDSKVLANIFKPLLIILDGIHELYLESTNGRLSVAIVLTLFNNEEMMNSLVDMIYKRSAIMNIMYKIFLTTKENRIRSKKVRGIKCNFFPFNIFSLELFVLGHLMDFLK